MTESTIDSTSQTADASSGKSTLWQVELHAAQGQPDRIAAEVLSSATDLQLPPDMSVSACRGFLIQGNLDESQVREISRGLLAEPVVETFALAQVGDESLASPPVPDRTSVYVLPLPGVTDPEAESAKLAIRQLGFAIDEIRTFKRYWVSSIDDVEFKRLCSKILCNDSIETIVVGKLELDELHLGHPYQFEKSVIALADLEDEKLESISKQWQLSLSLVEMQTIQQHYQRLGREPTDVELETIAQTWSEHCSHKTLAGRITYRDENGERQFDNMLKETIFSATMQIREDLGDQDWCVSVFKDNAGIVRFDDDFNVAFKVETHNRPSALEPYGGANTGIGGVIRDTLGTGLGAKPICNTDVFCFASPDIPFEDLPPGVMHPRLIMKGVVSGVRDYGNRMGIPTVNGAVYFDDRYIGNPLVFCGNVGLIPKSKSFKQPRPNDLIVSIGGKTGRDGIHGATFSSAELTEESDITSGGAVQIGNAITEKMLMDVMLAARDRELYTAVTDCGAGGYSSAVGEMGEEIGAEVWLDKVPLKYEGLSYTEIWISEAQERMVFAIPEENWPEFHEICATESVEATIIGRYVPTGRLELKYHDEIVGDLSMEFLHEGRPPVVRQAEFEPLPEKPIQASTANRTTEEWNRDLHQILGSLNVASKHWIIRQYDHEVQGGSVLKPLVGVANDGPGDAAVVRPRLESNRGLVIGCGMNPHYGDIDPYHMAASSIDEAIRNCVAVGADPNRIAILDNFCWGHTDRPSTLGSLVRAALACHDMSIVFQTPFISGKDSLHNEFSFTGDDGNRTTISIPSTLLISAMGQVPDVQKCVSMDLKSPGNLIYQVGITGDHLGGSHWCLVNKVRGGSVPTVEPATAKRIFERVHAAILDGLIRSCHDLSEGGLATAAAEMAFAGGLGAELDIAAINVAGETENLNLIRLFSESNTRFLLEVEPSKKAQLESQFEGLPLLPLGVVNDSDQLVIRNQSTVLVDAAIDQLKASWQSPLDWA